MKTKKNNAYSSLIENYKIANDELINANAKIEKIEKRQKAILRTAMDGYWLVDLQGNLIEVNDRYCELSGYSEAELLSMKVSDIETIESFEDTKAHIQRIVELGRDRFESVHRKKDGSTFTVDVNAKFLQIDGGLIVVFMSDITDTKLMMSCVKEKSEEIEAQNEELRQINEELREAKVSAEETAEFNKRIIASSRDCIKVLDLDGNLLSMSEGGQKLLEIDNIKSYYNKSWVDFWKGDDNKEANAAITSAINDESKVFYGFCPTEKGTPKWWEICISPIHDYQGNVYRLLAVSHDVTHRRIEEQKLRENNEMLATINEEYEALNEEYRTLNDDLIKAKEKAEESDKLKTAFLANMSHEIRTPLNAIVGFSKLIFNQKINNEKKNRFQHLIEYNSNVLISIIDDIIDLSKIEAGIMKFNEEHVCLDSLMNDFLSTSQLLLLESGKDQIKMNYNKTESGIIIKVDRSRFIQILTNLVTNAIKYTERGIIEIGYSIKEENLQFYVKDTGIGISSKDQSKVFSRFYKANNEYHTQRGVGLGLAIIKQIIENMGGKIWVVSALAKGSIFYFTIPYKPVSFTSSIELNEKQKYNLAGKRALVAEDDDGNFLLSKIVLENAGIRVIRAKTGIEAVELCKENSNIDFILMDMKMPELNGLEATKMIRKFNKDIRIIALSAYVLEEMKEEALKWGCNSFLTKPIDEKVLLESLENAVWK